MLPQIAEFLFAGLAALLALWGLKKGVLLGSSHRAKRPGQLACLALMFGSLLAAVGVQGSRLLTRFAPGEGIPLAHPRLAITFWVAALVLALVWLLLWVLDFCGHYPILNANRQQNLRQAKTIALMTVLLSVGGYVLFDAQTAMTSLVYGPFLSLVVTEAFSLAYQSWLGIRRKQIRP